MPSATEFASSRGSSDLASTAKKSQKSSIVCLPSPPPTLPLQGPAASMKFVWRATTARFWVVGPMRQVAISSDLSPCRGLAEWIPGAVRRKMGSVGILAGLHPASPENSRTSTRQSNTHLLPYHVDSCWAPLWGSHIESLGTVSLRPCQSLRPTKRKSSCFHAETLPRCCMALRTARYRADLAVKSPTHSLGCHSPTTAIVSCVFAARMGLPRSCVSWGVTRVSPLRSRAPTTAWCTFWTYGVVYAGIIGAGTAVICSAR